MTPIRSRWAMCALMVLTGLPLWAQESPNRPTLSSRDSVTATAPLPNSNVIPEGTTFLARLDDKLDTRKLQQGKHFNLKLAEDLVAPNGAIIPRGKKIKGHVSAIEQSANGGQCLLELVATVTGVPGEHAIKQIDEEGEIQRKGMSKRHVIEAVAVGAGLGAAAGAAAGGGRGAGIGAGAGAGLGALTGFLTDHDLRLDKGTTLELRLDRALQVPMR